ncbi:MAG: DNA polymerase III subunit gamma/tau [Sulfuritalea sp.]|jgi:DNA polymerase-3 subunit gamma/tau|nr:DNA polymerase III subunit gamma/tau [Sulfuritalea sp.]
MSYQVLARKWRPKSFATLVGQEHVVRALTHALDQNRLHHAYLFTGTRGVGKTTLARIMAKALNCEAGVSSTPCGVCGACTEIDGGRFIDYIELDAASNRGVDDMTQLLERATYAPTSGRYKVYVIDEVHQLSGHAFNAMLKTLEEPPEHVKFILATTDPQKIPVTVLSRCLQFNLKQMPLTHIVDHLSRVLEAEGVAFEPAALRHLAKGAAGSMRDALSLLDQAIAHGAGEVEDEGVRAMLGTVGDEHLFALLDGLVAQDVQAMLEVAKLMDARSLSFDGGLQELATLFHRIALAQFAPEALLDDAERSRLMPYAQALDAEYLQLAYQIAIHGRDELSLAPDDYAGFVMTLLRLHAFGPERAGAIIPAPRSAAAAPLRQPAPLAAAAASVPRPGAVPPAPTSASAAKPSAAACTSDADWHVLAGGLPGMARQLAQNCELVERAENLVRLRLTPAHKHLQVHQEKLRAALRELWGGSLGVDITVAEPAGETPAARRQNSERERQEKAIAAIEQDPFVRDVVDLFDASIDQSTIKPV